jgi:hypothetical protein
MGSLLLGGRDKIAKRINCYFPVARALFRPVNFRWLRPRRR